MAILKTAEWGEEVVLVLIEDSNTDAIYRCMGCWNLFSLVL